MYAKAPWLKDIRENYIEEEQECKDIVTPKGTKMQIVRCTLKSSSFIERMARGTKQVTFTNAVDSIWWLAVVSGQVVGSCCCVITGNTARFKSDFMLEDLRGKGCYKALSDARMEYAIDQNCSMATAFSSPMSQHQFFKDGFEVQSKKKNGIVFVRKVL